MFVLELYHFCTRTDCPITTTIIIIFWQPGKHLSILLLMVFNGSYNVFSYMYIVRVTRGPLDKNALIHLAPVLNTISI